MQSELTPNIIIMILCIYYDPYVFAVRLTSLLLDCSTLKLAQLGIDALSSRVASNKVQQPAIAFACSHHTPWKAQLQCTASQTIETYYNVNVYRTCFTAAATTGGSIVDDEGLQTGNPHSIYLVPRGHAVSCCLVCQVQSSSNDSDLIMG